MNPILMDETKSLYEILNDNSLGLGTLPCRSCLAIEERNGIDELEFQISINDSHYSDLRNDGIIKAKAGDTRGIQMYRIYEISKPMRGIVTVYCRHITYDLNKVAVTPFNATGALAALEGARTHTAGTYSFETWTDISNSSTRFAQDKPASFRSILGGTQGSILDVFGGEYEWDNLTVKLHAHRGTDNGVSIEYGKNLIDLTQEENIENTYTAILGYATSGESVIVGDLQTIIESSNPKTYVVDLTSAFGENDSITVESVNVKAIAFAERNNITVPTVNIAIKFVPLWQTEEYKNIAPLERVSLCDTVHVKFAKLGIEVSAKVIKTTYNVLTERYEEIEIGDAKSSLTKTLAETISTAENIANETESMMDKEIARATSLITGGLGGYVVIGRNADGQPQEILVMDTADKATAVNVIRINRNGIGFSNSGYEGPFRSAWTIDGHFVADFITAGTLNANLIKAGLLTDEQGTNWWNMETGEISISSYQTKSDADQTTQILEQQINIGLGELSSRVTEVEENVDKYVSRTGLYPHVGLYPRTGLYPASGITGYATVSYTESLVSQTASEISQSVSQEYSTKEETDAVASQINSDLNNFVQIFSNDIEDLKNQIDGSIDTWFYNYAPTLSNAPASSWTTDELKRQHVGDLFYEQDTGQSWRFVYDNTAGIYKWVEITDTASAEALAKANLALDTADGKRRVFIDTPTPPYDEGDLWMQGSGGDILTCISPKTSSQYYARSDWSKMNKYTDDTYAEDVNERLINNYPTTVVVNSLIDQKSDEIMSTVSARYLPREGLRPHQGLHPNRLVYPSMGSDSYASQVYVESKIDQKADSITASVENRYQTKNAAYIQNTQIYSRIEMTASQIQSTVSRTYETKNNATTQRANLQSQITQNAQSITTKVSQTDYNGNTIASMINQSATTVKIQASRINLTGYVTMTNLATNGQTTINGGNITARSLSLDSIRGGYLILGGSGNTNGLISIRDSSNNEIGAWDMNGIVLKKGTIDASGMTVTNLSASSITAGTLNVDRIQAGSISTSKLENGCVTNPKIDDSAVSYGKTSFTGTLDQVGTNTGNISWNRSDINTNSGNIGTNSWNISQNSGNISTNAGNIGYNYNLIQETRRFCNTLSASGGGGAGYLTIN